jgi:hypothetical protein
MKPVWDRIQTVLNGTHAMRKAGEKYLPRYEAEMDKAYKARREGAVLFNVTDRTLKSWVGRPFSDPVKIGEDVPEDVKELLKDIDMQGNDVAVFARNWFSEGLAKAFAHVLIEMPRPDDPEDGRKRSKADDIEDGVRPFWSLIAPENLIFASGVMVGSREVLTHARIKESVMVREGWEEVEVKRIRVYDRDEKGVYYSLYELQNEGQDDEKWVEKKGKTPLDIERIPIVTFYADRQGLMFGKSPIEDLADLNIAHWQSNSDQNNILTVSRFPILAASGITKEESKIALGPRVLLYSANQEAKFYYVEHKAASIGAGRQNLLDLEEQMAEYGADFLRKRPGNVTATARALDSAEATSPLQDAAWRFNDALEQAMDLMAEWLGVEEVGTLTVPVDFGPEDVHREDLDAVKEARRMRDLSREKYLAELKRRGVLVDEFDEEENIRELKAEDSMVFDGAAQNGDINPEDDENVEE